MNVGVVLLLLQSTLPTFAHGMQPIHEAAASGDVAAVLAEVCEGVSIDLRDDDGFTALHYALAAGKPEVAIALLDDGADINAPGRYGVTPLHLTIAANDRKAIALLLERGAEPSPHLGAAEFTRIDPLAWKRYPGGRDARAISPVCGEEVKVPLTFALKAGDRRVSAVCHDGDTPLHWAVHRGNPDTVALLLEKGADVNAQAWYGWTPLHEAAQKGSGRLAALLLDAGAAPSARMTNSEPGLTPLAVAEMYGNYELARLIRQRGGSE